MGVQLLSVSTRGRQGSSFSPNRAAELPRRRKTTDDTDDVDSAFVIAVKVTHTKADVQRLPST